MSNNFLNLESSIHGDSNQHQDPERRLNPLFGTHINLKQGSGSPVNPVSNSTRREIGDLAIWSLSSAKHGNGVEQLRDNQVTTFW